MIHLLTIFGASGDLTTRKLIPALYELERARRLPEPLSVVGVSRRPYTDEQWRKRLEESVRRLGARFDQKIWRQFEKRLFYFGGDVGRISTFRALDVFLHRRKEQLAAASHQSERNASTNRVYYLALAPDRYAETVRHLAEAGMTRETPDNHCRIIVEKPFGRSHETAKALNAELHKALNESQIFRIDHYLGKETVNNIFVLRFANTIFEPVWNRTFVDHVEITAHESAMVAERGAFYETAGVLRDMFQNHLLQLLAVTAMEPPTRFDAKQVRDEKVKLIRAIRPTENGVNSIVFGQYEGYRSEKNVAPDSIVPTFAALRLFIDNSRWKDVPFYLRSGKGMSCATTQIVIQFRRPPHLIFEPDGDQPAFPGGANIDANRLLIQIQPAEGIRLSFLTKIPGTETRLRTSELVYTFADDSVPLISAYERLLLDALDGDAALFARDDEIDAAWRVIDPLTQIQTSAPLYGYKTGGWGPDESTQWLANDQRRWFDQCPVLRKPGAAQGDRSVSDMII